MNKSIAVSALSLFLTLGIQSCRKCEMKDHNDETTVTQTVNVSLKTNESYTYSLPVNTSDDPFKISTPASHSKISEMGMSSSGMVYNYTPATDYSGNDQVVISSVEEDHHGQHDGQHHNGGGNCGHGQGNHSEQHTIIIINFTIQTPSSVSVK